MPSYLLFTTSLDALATRDTRIRGGVDTTPKWVLFCVPAANRLTKCATHGRIEPGRKSGYVDPHHSDTYAVCKLSEAFQRHDFLPLLLRLYVADFLSRSARVRPSSWPQIPPRTSENSSSKHFVNKVQGREPEPLWPGLCGRTDHVGGDGVVRFVVVVYPELPSCAILSWFRVSDDQALAHSPLVISASER
jgi:hypothetical protein